MTTGEVRLDGRTSFLELIRPNLGHILFPFGAKFDESARNMFLS